MSYEPQAVFLTHYGRVTNVEKLGFELRLYFHQLKEMALEIKKKGEVQQEQLSAVVRKIIKNRLHNTIVNFQKSVRTNYWLTII